jgi:hypothetical protein
MTGKDEASMSIARDLAIDLEEAQRWCDAWERFAKRAGVNPRRPYYWDAARGWIDAQRSFAQEDRSSGRRRPLDAPSTSGTAPGSAIPRRAARLSEPTEALTSTAWRRSRLTRSTRRNPEAELAGALIVEDPAVALDHRPRTDVVDVAGDQGRVDP